MTAKWGTVLLLGLVFTSSVDAGTRGRIHLVRGGASRSLVRQIQQYQQQMQKEEVRLAAQEQVALQAAEQKRHELHQSAATANREIRQHEKERGDRTRKRAANSANSKAAPDSADDRRPPAKVGGSNTANATTSRTTPSANDARSK